MHGALAFPRTHAPKSLITAVYNTTNGQILVENPKGHHFRTMGRADATGRMHLLPEEALYLLERGNLYLRWSLDSVDESDVMPFSLQSAYAVLIGQLGLTLERYTVYTGLKRSGYVVLRAPEWYPETLNKVENALSNKPAREELKTFSWLYELLLSNLQPMKAGPLVGPGLYRCYSEVKLVCMWNMPR
jgi:tRNA-splicing endonuclease subunit Sen54